MARAVAAPVAGTATGTEHCLVIGAGSQGTLACIALGACGISPAVLDPHPGRQALATELGARPAGAAESGFGLVFETSGAPEALAEAVGRAARGGLIVLMGLNSQPVPVVTQRIVQRQLTLMGSLIYDHPGDFARVTGERGARGGLGPGLGAGRVLRDDNYQEPTMVAADNLNPQKAWVLLTLALTRTSDPDTIQRMFDRY